MEGWSDRTKDFFQRAWMISPQCYNTTVDQRIEMVVCGHSQRGFKAGNLKKRLRREYISFQYQHIHKSYLSRACKLYPHRHSVMPVQWLYKWARTFSVQMKRLCNDVAWCTLSWLKSSAKGFEWLNKKLFVTTGVRHFKKNNALPQLSLPRSCILAGSVQE